MKAFTIMIAACCLMALCSGFPEKSPAAETPAGEKIQIVNGPLPSVKASAGNFTGDVEVATLPPLREHLTLSGGYVSFAPGARTNWHTHPEGQMLLVVSGKGRVRQWGGPLLEIKEGDVVWFPGGVKHWHGAAPEQAMTHLSLAPIIEGKSSDWLEKVSDEQYNGR